MEEIYKNFMLDFNKTIYSLGNGYSDYIFLCIGTDRMTGDAFGPLVGKRLQELLSDNYTNVFVIGNLREPISFTNINYELEKIHDNYEKPCIIAVDAALSKKEDIGKIIVEKEETFLGKGLNKKACVVGDVSIKGIVAKNFRVPKQNFYMLQNTSLNLVMDLAEATANGIYKVITKT